MSITKNTFLHASIGPQSFCSNLDFLFSNINDELLAGSIIIANFNTERLKWCTTDKNNTAGLGLDSFTTTAG